MNKTEIKWVYRTTGDLPEAPDDIYEKMWLRENNWGTPGTLENTNFIGGIMRHLIRRLMILPLIICVSPILYIILWLTAGRLDGDDMKDVLVHLWTGE